DEDKGIIKDDVEPEIKKKMDNSHWHLNVSQALNNRDLGEALEIFKAYELNSTDAGTVEKDKAFFYLELFEQGFTSHAIDGLLELIRVSKKASKYDAYMWLSYIYVEMRLFDKAESLWNEAIDFFCEDSELTSAIVELAGVLVKNNKFTECHALLINHFKEVVDDKSKSEIYKALANLEKAKGNLIYSVFCEDKALEYNFDSSLLFDSAYEAAENNINALSISNYESLLKVEPKHGSAINNLGVLAKQENMDIIAVDCYRKGSDFNITLSMANQGQMLLEAGFIQEAETIAKEALKQEEVHENVHGLLAKISAKRREQDQSWKELTSKCYELQKNIRSFTEQLYFGCNSRVLGTWRNECGDDLFELKNDQVNIEIKDGFRIGYRLNGFIVGSTFRGKVEIIKENSSTGQINIFDNKIEHCFGFIDDKSDNLIIKSENFHSNFTLTFVRA
ncbi:lipopolysaccharide assembly protein LapB, partial [Shewanella sp. MBTL60-007]|uniref:tetratricopeptide repeat protein n=1 Tax=Shewanella sp. MBTL60-007 TaxID=2815911 RepID=UPI001C81EFAC